MTLTLYLVPADVSATITPGGPPVTVTTTSAGQNARLTFAGHGGRRTGRHHRAHLLCDGGFDPQAGRHDPCLAEGHRDHRRKGLHPPDGHGYAHDPGRLSVDCPGERHRTAEHRQHGAGAAGPLAPRTDDGQPRGGNVVLLPPGGRGRKPDGHRRRVTAAPGCSDFPGLSGGFTPTGLVPTLLLFQGLFVGHRRDPQQPGAHGDRARQRRQYVERHLRGRARLGCADDDGQHGRDRVGLEEHESDGYLDAVRRGRLRVAATHYTSNGATPTTASPQGPWSADRGVCAVKYFSVDNVQRRGREDRRDPGPHRQDASELRDAERASRADPAAGSSGTATDALSGIVSLSYFYCAGASCTPTVLIGSSSAGPSYPVTWAGQPVDGTYQVLARATDAAGNILNSAKQTVVVDNSPPDTTITVAPTSPSTASVSFTFTATEAGSTFECELDGGGFAACTSPKPYTGLASGSHTFRVRATDPAGNVDATPAAHTWTVDALAPNTTITANPPALSSSSSAAFTFISTEPETFECRLDAGASPRVRARAATPLDRRLAHLPGARYRSGRKRRRDPRLVHVDGRHDRSEHDHHRVPEQPQLLGRSELRLHGD